MLGPHRLAPICHPASAPTDTHLLPLTHRPFHQTPTHTAPSPTDLHPSHRFNFPVGDILQDKPDHVLRLYVQNVNGIKLDKDKVQFTSLLRHMSLIQADYFAFVETKRETQHHSLHQQLQHSLSRSFNHHRSVFATSPQKIDTYSKPGGVSCTIANDLVGRVADLSKDILGRWTTTKLVRKDGKFINIITAYQCVPHILGRHHTRTVYAQQWAALRALDQQIDPRKAFIADLKSHILALHNKRETIILGGDFNEILGADNTGLLSILRAGDLVDTIHMNHPSEIDVPKYKRGGNRIDFIFISRHASEAVVACGAEPFGARIQSDHRGLFLDLDSRVLSGRLLSLMAPHALCGLQSRNSTDVTRYVDYLHEHFESHNIYAKARALNARPILCPTQANALDRLITEGMLGAEKRVKKKRQLPWSPELIQAVEQVTLWKQAVTSCLNDVDMTAQINHTLRNLDTQIDLPADLESRRQGLKESLTSLRCISAHAAEKRRQFLNLTIISHEAANTLADDKSAIAARHIQKAEEIKQLF
jgi:exonuclease III